MPAAPQQDRGGPAHQLLLVTLLQQLLQQPGSLAHALAWPPLRQQPRQQQLQRQQLQLQPLLLRGW
jgi:hypothetical protein